MPDVTDGKKLTVAGEESWDAHCLRNRSIVMDTFYGQFKSKCVCPICNRLSVSFDAFNHVSLEIPQRRNDMTLSVLLFASNLPSVTPIRYAITVSKNGRMSDVKIHLSNLSKIPKERLGFCEVYQNKISEIFNDEKQLQFLERDVLLVAYEIDPYSKSTMHVISSQYKFRTLSQSEGRAFCSQKHGIGYPLLSSFDADLSCLEVWYHFRDRLRYINPELEEEQIMNLFQIRIVDGNGDPRSVFCTLSNDDDKGNNSIDSSSILPKSNEKLISFLEAECVESFLFVEIEWVFNEEKKALDELNFISFVNHSSIMEAIEKQREAITLEHCFEQFTFPENLDDDNKWYCSTCKKHVRAEKTMGLWRLPNVLIVHLKRFEFKQSLRREKLETLIDCPLEGLDMGKFCTSSSHGSCHSEQNDFVVDNVPADYDLFGVVNHYGRMGFGHYTAYARRWTKETLDNDWVVFDDSSVRRISKDQIISSNAYVLFYRRRIFI